MEGLEAGADDWHFGGESSQHAVDSIWLLSNRTLEGMDCNWLGQDLWHHVKFFGNVKEKHQYADNIIISCWTVACNFTHTSWLWYPAGATCEKPSWNLGSLQERWTQHCYLLFKKYIQLNADPIKDDAWQCLYDKVLIEHAGQGRIVGEVGCSQT